MCHHMEALSQYQHIRDEYDTLHNMLRAESGTQEMRITRLWPHTEWTAVWKNIGVGPVSGTNRAAWYTVLHDIIPTHERLHNIRMVSTDMCSNRV